MKISEIKRQARKTIKFRYFRSLVVIFVTYIIINGGYNYITVDYKTPEEMIGIVQNIDIEDINIPKKNKKENIEIVEEFIGNIGKNIIIEKDSNKHYKYNRGIFASLINNINSSGNIVLGILNAVNQIVFNNKISEFILILLGVLLSLLYFFFIANVIEVGKIRYFIEHRRYKDTKIDRLFFPYRVKQIKHISWIVLITKIYQFLWCFTIIGGIIKRYSYAMVPYILAENPIMSRKDTIKLSRDMMENHKLEMFKLDLSLIGWYILGILTVNLSNMFFFAIYRESIYTEYYMYIRKCAKENNITNADLLCDKYLDVEIEEGKYPDDKYLIPSTARRRWLEYDYEKDYTVITLILFFFTTSIFGWVWEVALHVFTKGTFINRGVMFGPWLPIYGFGAIGIIVLLKPFRKRIWLLFLLTIVLCGVVEYGTAWYLETFKQLKWWDYSGYFLNLHGRICAEGLIIFGFAGIGFTYIVAPILDNIYEKVPSKIKITICIVLLTLFAVDSIYSHFNPNTGYGITDYAMSQKVVAQNNIKEKKIENYRY